jgi:hypothetical protein
MVHRFLAGPSMARNLIALVDSKWRVKLAGLILRHLPSYLATISLAS